MRYDWNFSRLHPYTEAFLYGTLTTIGLTTLVILIGTFLGVGLGLLIRDRGTYFFFIPFIDSVRALPPLVLLLFLYYLLARQVIGVGVPAFWVCVIAFSLNLAAFTAELVRSAIHNVPRTVIDAGLSLGMSRAQITRYLIIPYVFREVIPGMTVLYIGMLKMSSIASVINVGEVVYAAQTVIADISRSLEAWVVVAAIYLSLVIPATYAARQIERVVNRGRRQVE